MGASTSRNILALFLLLTATTMPTPSKAFHLTSHFNLSPSSILRHASTLKSPPSTSASTSASKATSTSTSMKAYNSEFNTGTGSISSRAAEYYPTLSQGNELLSTIGSSSVSTYERLKREDDERLRREDDEIRINPVVEKIKISKTVEVFSNVKQMEAEGETVTSLCVGEPDFPPPKAVLNAIIASVKNLETKYTAVTGTSQLRKAISLDLQTRKNLKYDANSEILVSNGAKQSVFQSIMALCGDGDEVIIPSPYWPSYPEMVRLCGAVPVILDTKISNKFLVDPYELEAKITDKTKMIIFCNPSNPTGTVHPVKLMKEIAEVLRHHPKVGILSDEIYERLVYSEEPHVSFASLQGMKDRTLTVNGFSKAYAMTGLRLGYVAGPKEMVKAMTVIQSQLTSCASSLSQAAGYAALSEVAEEEMNANLENLREKRDYVVNRLKRIRGVESFVPDGAFYILPDVSKWFDGDDTKLCLELLKDKKLALVPGTSFGARGTVRLSYATSMEELKVAMDKLEDFLEERRL